MKTRITNTFTMTLQTVTETVHTEQPQMSETMATAIALLAMADFRRKIEDAQKDTRSNSPNNSRVPV